MLATGKDNRKSRNRRAEEGSNVEANGLVSVLEQRSDISLSPHSLRDMVSEKLLGGDQDRTDVLSNASIFRSRILSDQNDSMAYKWLGGDIQKRVEKAFSIQNHDLSPVNEDELLRTRELIQHASGLLELTPKKIRQLYGSKILLNTPQIYLPEEASAGETEKAILIGDENTRNQYGATFDEVVNHELYHRFQRRLHNLFGRGFGLGKIPYQQKPLYPIIEGSANSVLQDVNPEIYKEFKDKIVKHGLTSTSILSGLSELPELPDLSILSDDIIREIQTTINVSLNFLRNYIYPSVVLQDYKDKVGAIELDKWVGKAIRFGTPGPESITLLTAMFKLIDGTGNPEKLREHIEKLSSVIGY